MQITCATSCEPHPAISRTGSPSRRLTTYFDAPVCGRTRWKGAASACLLREASISGSRLRPGLLRTGVTNPRLSSPAPRALVIATAACVDPLIASGCPSLRSRTDGTPTLLLSRLRDPRVARQGVAFACHEGLSAAIGIKVMFVGPRDRGELAVARRRPQRPCGHRESEAGTSPASSTPRGRSPGRPSCLPPPASSLPYNRSPLLAGIIGARRAWTASMISALSMPSRYTDVIPRFACPSWRWMTLSGTPSRAISTAWA
jgi:hypothetical protein